MTDYHSLEAVLSRAGLPLPAGERLPFLSAEIEDSISSRLDRVVQLVPDNIAISLPEGQISYREFGRLVDHFSRTISSGRGSCTLPVALSGRTSTTMIAALFACFKLGRPYVFVPPDLPVSRAKFILKETRASCLIVEESPDDISEEEHPLLCSPGLPEIIPLALPSEGEVVGTYSSPANSKSLAYIIYTSGSTGRPKGVPQTHENILADIQRQSRDLLVTQKDRYGLLFNLGSSAAICHLGGALLNGATLCPLDLKVSNFHHVCTWLEREGITILDINVSTFRQIVPLLTEGENFPSLRLLAPGSEPLHRYDVELFEKYFSDHCILQNAFGTSETRTVTHYYYHRSQPLITSGEHITIGHPVETKEVVLLNNEGKPVALGEVGEIVVRSQFIASEYLGRPEESSDRFCQDLEAPEITTYYTRDLAKRIEGDFLIHLGRKDNSIKIRGHLVDFSEVEKALRSCSEVGDAVVVHYQNQLLNDRIAAFIIPSEDAIPTPAALSEQLKVSLPGHMIPSDYRFVDTFPYLPNQKLDRVKLTQSLIADSAEEPPISQSSSEPTALPAPPATEWESRLLYHWKKLLGRPDIGVHDDFMSLGGDSLNALSLFSVIESAYGVAFTAVDVFQAFTIASMAKRAEELEMSRGQPSSFEGQSRNFIVTLKSSQESDSVIFFPGGWGGDQEIVVFAGIARQLSVHQQIFGIRSKAMETDWEAGNVTLASRARELVDELISLGVDPTRVTLIGECLASPLAVETASLLEEEGTTIEKVILLDPFTPKALPTNPAPSHPKEQHMPEAIRQYYQLLKHSAPHSIRSNIHVITTSDSEHIAETIEFWSSKTEGSVHQHAVESDHDAYIREDLHETAQLLESLLP